MRPILMTSFTTILGLLPMVLPFFLPFLFGPFEGRGSIWAPVGLVVISGLITSTILTLVIMPTIYSLIDDFGLWMKKVFYFSDNMSTGRIVSIRNMDKLSDARKHIE
jgi:HAE1 family hydrophobic/amphiphilic exporter-1